jgi:hypothetical protein
MNQICFHLSFIFDSISFLHGYLSFSKTNRDIYLFCSLKHITIGHLNENESSEIISFVQRKTKSDRRICLIVKQRRKAINWIFFILLHLMSYCSTIWNLISITVGFRNIDFEVFQRSKFIKRNPEKIFYHIWPRTDWIFFLLTTFTHISKNAQ